MLPFWCSNICSLTIIKPQASKPYNKGFTIKIKSQFMLSRRVDLFVFGLIYIISQYPQLELWNFDGLLI